MRWIIPPIDVCAWSVSVIVVWSRGLTPWSFSSPLLIYPYPSWRISDNSVLGHFFGLFYCGVYLFLLDFLCFPLSYSTNCDRFRGCCVFLPRWLRRGGGFAFAAFTFAGLVSWRFISPGGIIISPSNAPVTNPWLFDGSLSTVLSDAPVSIPGLPKSSLLSNRSHFASMVIFPQRSLSIQGFCFRPILYAPIMGTLIYPPLMAFPNHIRYQCALNLKIEYLPSRLIDLHLHFLDLSGF